MKKMIMLLISGIGCFTVADVTAMMVVRKIQLIPHIRTCSQDCFESIRRVQIANDYHVDWYKDRINEQQLKKLFITQQSLQLDLTDQFHFDKDLYEISVYLTKCDLEIHKNIKLIEALERENKKLEKKYRNWKRS